MSALSQLDVVNEIVDISGNVDNLQDQDQDQEEPSADQEEEEEPSADQDQEEDKEPSADTADQDQDQANLIKYNEKVLLQLNELVQVVCRQTELTEEEARERLEKEKYNYMKVLNDYFGVKEIIRDSSSSTNQQIYGEIRNLMDTGARNFRNEQERTQYIQKVKDANNVKIE